ncbi:MAG: tRNA nucleotidyltransferase/poly(A) polymerase [Candidatus Uhrbacteria bacterium GW2011_GWA2_52_8d]|uniref:tRNA nucleotidyltransferase/poly(A) polymerase n=1 Tax=Candidatus Uhrbacteria bacterium GW2011_GWA2_52_8d TaxID=1618979 RepID=A0A0G1XPJ1_9BACT|nr:MAG: tRNA nucleotidyltransferase/poly(A) polymerase [Candidatus Uhrbacteria bacterium GW2011_GWA2_52_8d]
MLQEDHIAHTLQSHRELSFIDGFFADHPTAGLYLVGGAVRDALLARHPHEVDFDFVVTGLAAPKLEAWFRTRGAINLVGQHFGVYKFMPTGFSPEHIEFIDIALPRTEMVTQGSLGGYKDFDVQSDPNLPIEEDLARRDFTINAMAFDVRTQTLIDPFNGRTDLAQKTLRAVGDPTQRFTEDLSRILRGIRFASELDFVIEEETGQAIKTLIPKLNLQKDVEGKREYVVPRETVGMELAKALCRNPAHAIKELEAHGALQELFPEIHKKIGQTSSYLAPLQETTPGELTVVLTLLLRDLSLDNVRQTLSFTGLDTLARGSSQRTEAQIVTMLVQLLQEDTDPTSINKMRASKFEKRYFNGTGLLFLRCLEVLGHTDLKRAIETRRKQIEDRWLVDHDESIAPLLSGQDVLAKGVSAGPEIRIWLERVRDLQLDGTLMRREDALAWLATQIKLNKNPSTD